MTRDEAEALRQDPQHWTLGIIYTCPEDPRVIVRNRFPLGWTWNFGHRWVVPTLLAFILVVVGPVLLLMGGGVTEGRILIAVAAVSVGVLVGIANYIAAGPR